VLDDRGEVPFHRYQLELREVDLARLAALYATTLPVEVLSGRATLTAELGVSGDEVKGEVSLVLSGLQLAEREGRTLFGLSPELSAAAVEGLNRYAADLPIVLGFAVDGPAAAPRLRWERPLLEIARQGLIMEGRRELAGAIEELGARIDLLGPGGEIPLSGDYAELKKQVEEAAARLIQGAAGRAVPSELSEMLKQLLQGILQPQQPEEEDQEEP